MKKILLLIGLIFLTGCGRTTSGVDQNVLVPREPEQSELTEFEIEEKEIVSILHFGDIMLDRNVKRQIDKNGEEYLFGELAGTDNNFFEGYDLVMANLEGPFADWRRETTKEIAFRFDPALISMLQKYNFNLFSLANNHSLDMGKAGFTESKENLTNAGIDSFGIGYGVGDESLFFKEVNGIKLAFVGVDDTLTPINEAKMKDLLSQAEASADYTLVDIHWGNEYQPLNSSARQRYLAKFFVDNGADLIIGHHPHVIQEVEVYKNKAIFYSLGNTIFDQYFSGDTQQGLALAIKLSKENKIEIRLFLLEGVESQISLMDESEAQALMKKLVEKSRLGEYNIEEGSLSL